MSAHKINSDDLVSASVEDIASKLLPIIARRKMARNIPVNAGASFFYEVDAGWETSLHRNDNDISTVTNIRELEAAFIDPIVKTILIPAGSAVSRAFVLRVCRRHGRGKTVFYESVNNG